MAESNELQVLDTICTEVDEAKIKVILTTQCIKAQAFLVEKLKRQIKRNKETCRFISSANLKLQSEITQAEQEIKSMQLAKETIKMANVELKKEWLVSKEKKLDIIERVQSGAKKYEELWIECKSRYESLPYVQTLLKATETARSLEDQITSLDTQAETLSKEIEAKTESCFIVDRKRVIQLAEFMIQERPKMIDTIIKKSKALSDLNNERQNFDINSASKTKALEQDKKIEGEPTPKATENFEDKNINDSDLIMPKLQLNFLDIDDLISVKLDQVKTNKVDYASGLEIKQSSSKSYFDMGTSMFNRKTDIYESLSNFFKPTVMHKETKSQNYSKKKLINILEDVQIDAKDAMNLIMKANPDILQPVESISARSKFNVSEDIEISRNIEPMQIEEIDIPPSNEENIVKPPTQFLDASLNTEKSQDLKKKVSFNLSDTPQNDAINETDKSDAIEANETINSQQVVNAVSDDDDGLSKIKDMELKKHKLDLTPPFVYAKKAMLPMKTEEKIVTSKFFKSNKDVEDETKDKQNETVFEEHPIAFEYKSTANIEETSTKIIELDVEDDKITVSSPKEKNIDEMSKPLKPHSGYLFGLGPQGLPESLDASMNTTGFEDMYADFPHCIDSSLLLSPKADIPTCSDNPEGQSQDAPNFLSGLRKTGMSFFGLADTEESKPDSSATNEGSSGFSFNFSGKEKKNRTGFFSMFQ